MGIQGGVHPVTGSDHSSYTAHASNPPSDVTNSNVISTSQGWIPPPGTHIGFPPGFVPNLGIPPPGLQSSSSQGWPWQYSQAAFTPFSSQQTHPGMFFQQPWIGNAPSNISNIPCIPGKTDISDPDRSYVNPSSARLNPTAPLYSNVVANTAWNVNTNTMTNPNSNLNTSNYGLQNRKSAISGNRGAFTKHESKEVRRKSMPAPASSSSDGQNFSVRIGTQVI